MKRNSKKTRKVRKLIITCVLSAIVLIVSTYTWFIGMQTVKVNPFDIEIATTEGLFISMDGESWQYNLNVNDAKQYDGNTNSFATNGLIPMSSVGDLDPEVSRMKLFEKGSLTTTPGGYRLLASRVDNHTKTTTKVDGVDVTTVAQGDGYVVFDLFIKNLSGAAYYENNEVKNEEAIYLTVDSEVKVKNTGTSDPQLETGIENSIRVGFTQIGRVKATTTDASVITGMTCNIDTGASSPTKGQPVYTAGTGVTGICRNAQIWEPNDTKHVDNAINWYKKACIARTGDGLDTTDYSVAQYDTDGDLTAAATPCATFTGAVPTYAISRELKVTADSPDNVDVYDGKKFNTYEGNSTTYATYSAASDKSGYKLVEYPYFTDEMKNRVGTSRPSFMTLAPNSITKVRVYVWLEGQDIDNYDFAQMGKTISVNFGFTKERFNEDYDGDGDKEYNGPALVTSDNADISTSDNAQ